MMDENTFENLNDKQKEAVLATEGYVRVIAGAGSGKTKHLVSRYAYLVQDFLNGFGRIFPKGIEKLCSRFLEEIGTENYKRIGLVSDELARESRAYAKRLDWEIEAERRSPLDKKVGDPVEHHAFGSGVIQGVDAKKGCYIIKFDNLSQPRNISKNYFGEERHAVAVNSRIVDDNPDSLKDDEDENYYDMEETEFEDIDEAESFLDDSDDSADDDARIEEAILEAKEKAKDSPNLWKRDDVPHGGWTCVGVDDLGAPVGICEMCGYQIIRYAHHMEHPQYRSLICGCVCAGKMEGSIEEAKRREAEFKNKQARRIKLFKRIWRRSKKGNDYLKIDDHVIVIYHIKPTGRWKYSIDNDFSQTTYNSHERAMSAAFEKLETMRNNRR